MPNTLEERIAALEAEVALLRKTFAGPDQASTTLIAPVRIVDSSGALLAELSRSAHNTGLSIFNSRGEAVARLGADGADAGYLAIQGGNGQTLALLDVEQYGARLQLNDSLNGGLVLFGGDCGEQGGGINICRSDGEIAAEFWSTKRGGELTFYRPGRDPEALVLPDALLKEP